jgi:putative ABC transport system ATP-binding protein
VRTTPSISETPSEIIRANELIFSYAKGRPVLNIPSLRVKTSERLFIHGPSGSGKTTLLGLLAGVLQAQSGRLEILDSDLCRMSPSKRDHFRGNHIGYVFQMFNLIPYLDVFENILLSYELNPSRKKRIGSGSPRAAARKIAENLGIGPLLKRKTSEISVGQQKRFAAARALLGSPEILIADEPTSALDSDHREKFLELLFSEARRQGSTILFVSHDRALQPLFDRHVHLPEINQACLS